MKTAKTRTTRRILALVLAVVLALSMGVTALAAPLVPADARSTPYNVRTEQGTVRVNVYTVTVGQRLELSAQLYGYSAFSFGMRADALEFNQMVANEASVSALRYLSFSDPGYYAIGPAVGAGVDVDDSWFFRAVPAATGARPAPNAVLVAGTWRIPGNIYSLANGSSIYTVNHGDTLWSITEYFYGDGHLWREVQRVNQQWLNQTHDGIIFVGFNLYLPAAL